MDDRTPTFPLDEPCEPTGADAVATADDIQRASPPVVYYGTDQQVSEGFAIALRIMGLDTNFLPPGALAASSLNMEDN